MVPFIDLRELSKANREYRIEALRAVADVLAPEELEDGIRALIAVLKAKPQSTKSRTQPKAAFVGSKTNHAEAYVLAHPGCTAEDVGAEIGQAKRTADGTLRHVARSRRSIERRKDGQWYPTDKAITKRSPSLQEATLRVLADGQPRGTAEIFTALREVVPDVKKASVATTVMRMKQNSLLVQKGPGPRGPLYGLASGISSTPKLSNGVHTTR